MIQYLHPQCEGHFARLVLSRLEDFRYVSCIDATPILMFLLLFIDDEPDEDDEDAFFVLVDLFAFAADFCAFIAAFASSPALQ